MPKRRKPPKGSRPFNNELFFCRRCYFVDKRSRDGYKGRRYLEDGECVSAGLKLHLTSEKFARSCGQYYRNNGLLNFQSSLIKFKYQPYPPQRTHTASEIGVHNLSHPDRSSHASRTICSPTTAPKQAPKPDLHRTLNQKVQYNSLRPPVDRSVIRSALSNHADHQLSNELQSSVPENDSLPNNSDMDNEDGIYPSSDDSSPNNHLTNFNKVPPFPVPRFELLPPYLVAEVELLNVLQKNHLPMNTFQLVMEWAHRQTERHSQRMFGFADNFASNRTRETIIKDIRNYIPLVEYSFRPHGINWLPDNKLVQVQVRSFQQALFSLLTNPVLVKEENFSFPLRDTPFLPNDFEYDPTVPMTELHHGRWWTQSWKSICQAPDKILVPIILYMDGISLDVNSHLNLTPLNMTLGIFDIKTRKKADAWETLYFHPDKITSEKKTEGIHNVTNLHNGIKVALQSFLDLCQSNECITWDELPYASKKWSVKMRFAIAYVIGDTELHDKLCCRFAGYTEGIKKICRHCQCETVKIADPTDRSHADLLWVPNDFVIDEDNDKNAINEDKKKFTAMSHHRMANVFHELQFGNNVNNIHMATPGECLHMHQLGIAKRTVESIASIVGNNKQFESIARRLGGALSRNSDREFPVTRFGTNDNVLNPSMKEGKHYAGMLLCILLALLSVDGQEASKIANKEFVLDQIQFIELVLCMEEFLKHAKIQSSRLNNLRKMMKYFLKQINRHCHREKGMGNMLIKNHLYLHVPEYMNRWGPPSGWDSAPSESHHKTEIKGPSKNTQRNPSSLIKQTYKRKREKHILKRVSVLYDCVHEESAVVETRSKDNKLTGTHGRIFKLGDDGLPQMTWVESANKNKPGFPSEVLTFCCDHILPIVKSNYVTVRTEHYRQDKARGSRFIFRASPSYLQDGGQDASVWYDWAVFSLEKETIPCQILCFVQIDELVPDIEHKVKGYDVEEYSHFAVVRRMITQPVCIEGSRLVKSGSLSRDMYLFDVETIKSEIAVVHNPSTNCRSDNRFMVVENRKEWLAAFYRKMNSL